MSQPFVFQSLGPATCWSAALADLPFAELQSFERSFLTAALERNGGNVSATARALGLHRQSLQKILRRLDLEP